MNNRKKTLTLAWLGAVAALVAVTGAAYGGQRTPQQQTERYADGLCSDILNWRGRIETIVESLQPGQPRVAAHTKLRRAGRATEDLVRAIHELPIPSTAGADQAKQDVDAFVADALTTAASIRLGVTRLQSYGTGASNVAAVVLPVGLELTTLVRAGKSTVASLKAINGSSFDGAVKQSAACRELSVTSSGT